MTTRNPYFIRVTEEEMPDFMAGKGDPPPRQQAQQQATSEATRWPTWGVIPGVNAFGPGTPMTTATTAAVSRRALPALVIIALVVLVVGSLVVALKMRGETVATYAPPAVQVEAQPPALTPRPTETREAIYAAAPTMTLYCDGQQRELVNARDVARLVETTPNWQRRCFAAYGWCETCQHAWYGAHP